MSPRPRRPVRCAIHLHSNFSDGSGSLESIIDAARSAGVELLLLTDHHKARAAQEGWEGWHEDLLLLVGIEFTTRQHHLLTLGIHDQVATRRLDTTEAVRLLRKLQATVFAAHPQGRKRGWNLLDRWSPEELEACDGLEAWSYMHDWIETFRPWRLPKMCREPARYVTGPHPDTLAAWDAEAERRRIPGLGAMDNHAKKLPLGFGRLLGWARGGILPYGQVFRDFAHYALAPPLTGEKHADAAAVKAALLEGAGWMAHEALHPAREFRFRLVTPDGGMREVGAEHPFAEGMRLRVLSPVRARLRIWRKGEVVTEKEDTEFSWPVPSPGAYRATAELDDRAWVVTNHISLREGVIQ